MQSPLFFDALPYRVVKDGDAEARAIADRHYSRKWRGKPGSALFVGPGVKMPILGVRGDWLFVWRLSEHRQDGQTGAECTLFRNEGRSLSSSLILTAEQAWEREHGPTRKFTYVNPRLIRSTNPGLCFILAGWKRMPGFTARGLVLLTKEVAVGA